MVHIIVRHQVADYAAWRRVYDEFEPQAAAMGKTGGSVYQSLDDANELTVVNDFATREAAEAFAGSDELKAAMGRAGVQGAPTMWFVSEA